MSSKPFNCIILGAGRSGTSLATGLLANGQYNFGGTLLNPNNNNPKGFFEAEEVNELNEGLLKPYIRSRPPLLGRFMFLNKPRRAARDRWIFPLRRKFTPEVSEQTKVKIEQIVGTEPYCLKDPRFCYTLEAWRPFLKNVKFLCIFRHPSKVIQSTLRMLGGSPEFHNLKVSADELAGNYVSMYSRVMDQHSLNGDWLFLHYDQLLTADTQKTLGEFLNTSVDKDFADTKLKRSTLDPIDNREALKIYQELCVRAGFRPE